MELDNHAEESHTRVIRKGTMELYHFTSPDRVDAILAGGLEPRNDNCRDGDAVWGLLSWPRDCVWLTRNMDEIPTVYGTWDKLRRIVAVRIPTADKRLISFVRWMREKLPEDVAALIADNLDNNDARTDWRSWWIYFGVIPPTRILGFAETHLIGPDGSEL
jgi:hypothetical protein